MAMGGGGIPPEELQNYQRLARMYVDVFETLDKVSMEIKAMQARIKA
jgi:hypothetical protein